MNKRSKTHSVHTPDLSATRRAAWCAQTWEHLWPLLLPLVCVVCVFVSLSWLGLWPSVSNQTRRFILGLFAVVGCLSLIPLGRFRLPTRSDINRRIEQKSGLEHQPVTTQADKPAQFTKSDDPMAKALWLEHQRRMSGKLVNLQPGTPTPDVARHDPYGTRALVGLLLFVGIAAGWGNWSSRILDAFRSHQVVAVATGRIDAWVTPPAYTNRPPIFLSQNNSNEPADPTVTVPEGSELVVRVLKLNDPSLLILRGDGATKSVAESTDAAIKNGGKNGGKKGDESQIFKIKLGSSSSVKLKSGEQTAAGWKFTVLPDHDPTIEFEDPPTGSSRGVLEFSFKTSDDYGVKSASAEIKSNRVTTKGAVPLIKAPEINLPLPRRKTKDGVAKTSHDLTSHPWAGSQVTMTLLARDDAGQTGTSTTKTFNLPERVFTKPLALAIVEERRNLALDINAAPQVAEMLDIITTTHPDIFIPDISVYTALRVSYRMISRAHEEEELKKALELLWETALAIEDGDLSRAERRLRDAQERLSKALQNGASDEEIDALMKELRQAMNEFMQELAQQMNRNQQNQQAMPTDPNAQVLRQQDIERMMKQIEDLAKSGSHDAARRLLEEMQRMMNNLQTAQPNQQQQRQSDAFSQQMDKLGDLMRQQQQLMDETFDMQRRQQQQQQQQGKGNRPEDQKPMAPKEFAEAMKQLQKQQGELQDQMRGLNKKLKELGAEPGKLGDAGKAMGEAEGKLGQGNPGPATGDQGRALQAMREGAQQMMQNMQDQAGEQGRRGERGQHGQQSRQDQDPLGRQSRSDGPQFGDDTKVPDEIDAQRAREILEAIRRKLGEVFRPKLELDYLDRLIPSR